MTSVKISDLKKPASDQVLAAIDAGETVELTDHDRPIARNVPIRDLGIIPPSKPLSEIQNRPYEPRVWPISSLELLLEDRNKDRNR